jgi:uncharacterized protein
MRTAGSKGDVMPALPPRPDLDQLRRIAKDRLRAARGGDADAAAWIREVGTGLTLSAAQLRLARHYRFSSWPALVLEVSRRQVLDLHDADTLAAFIADRPDLATTALQNWRDHPKGASPLGYIAMSRYDTATGKWRDVDGTGPAAHVLIAAGAPVDGVPGDTETPLITAASYGDADVAAVLIAAGANIDAVASDRAGGVPGGSALLHAAVFGMTDVIDLLVSAGAKVRSIEEAAAAGNVTGWLRRDTPPQACLRALVMASDHQRMDVIDTLVAAGTALDDEDEVFHRHPLRLAASNGRVASVRSLLSHGADPSKRDAHGLTPLDLCRMSRANSPEPTSYDEIEALLTEHER